MKKAITLILALLTLLPLSACNTPSLPAAYTTGAGELTESLWEGAEDLTEVSEKNEAETLGFPFKDWSSIWETLSDYELPETAPTSTLRVGFRAFGLNEPVLTVNEYDEDGNLLREYYDPVLNGRTGTRVPLRDIEYSHSGTPLSERAYMSSVHGIADGNPIGELVYEQSEKPALARFCKPNIDADARLMTGAYVTMTYDNKGNKRTETYFDETGSFDYQLVYSENGLLTDQVSERLHYRLYYNDEGAITRIESLTMLLTADGKAFCDKLTYCFLYDTEGNRVVHGFEGDEKDYYIFSEDLHVTAARLTVGGSSPYYDTIREAMADYDENGNLSSYGVTVTYPNNDEISPYHEEHTFTYTEDGRVLTQTGYTTRYGTRFLSRDIAYTYDECGNLTNYRGYWNPNGSVKGGSTADYIYTYDTDGRRLSYFNTPGLNTFTYNEHGHLVRKAYSSAYSASSETYSYAFDEAGRLCVRTTTYDGFFSGTQTERYEYNEDGRLLSYGLSASGARERELLHTYRWEGSTLRETVTEGYGNQAKRTEGTYAFDVLGRLVSCTCTEWADGRSEGYPRCEITMTYTYE